MTLHDIDDMINDVLERCPFRQMQAFIDSFASKPDFVGHELRYEGDDFERNKITVVIHTMTCYFRKKFDLDDC